MNLEEHVSHSKSMLARLKEEHEEEITNEKKFMIDDLRKECAETKEKFSLAEERFQTANVRVSALEKEFAARERPVARSPRRVPLIPEGR